MNILICLLLAVASTSPAPEITGTLVDSAGKPASGVSISVEAITSNIVVGKTVSQKDGAFSFSGIPSGGYGVVAKTDSACAISSAINVSDGYTNVIHLRLVKGLCQGAFAPIEHN